MSKSIIINYRGDGLGKNRHGIKDIIQIRKRDEHLGVN